MNTTPNQPVRVQRKRTKGWKMPPNTVYVGRPTIWGNPFDWKKLGRKHVVEKYRIECNNPNSRHIPTYRIKTLRGKNLACFCPLDQPCHADVLLKIANHD